MLFVQLPVQKEISGLSTATLCMKVDWRSATTTYGALSVMILLQGLIVLLFAGNLDLVIQVRKSRADWKIDYSQIILK